MQQSWRQDADKLTFIACLPLPSISSSISSGISSTSSDERRLLSEEDDAPGRMVGDTNLFLRVDDDDDDDGDDDGVSEQENQSKDVNVIGEIELMIAEKHNQGKGFGRAALLSFIMFITRHEEDILREFLGEGQKAQNSQSKGNKLKCLSVKIGKENGRSLALFESLGFEKVTQEPNYFGEFELRRYNLDEEEVAKLSNKHRVEEYRELPYRAE